MSVHKSQANLKPMWRGIRNMTILILDLVNVKNLRKYALVLTKYSNAIAKEDYEQVMSGS